MSTNLSKQKRDDLLSKISAIRAFIAARVVRRIDVNQINPSPVGLFQQSQRRQIVSLQQEVHLSWRMCHGSGRIPPGMTPRASSVR